MFSCLSGLSPKSITPPLSDIKMLNQDRWLLPEGIEEIFPDEAERLEGLGRRLIDRFRTWGYRLVAPPMVDYLDSLMTGSGHELDFQTLKFPDPVSGRLMGLRADMTPQVARIDARTATTRVPSRLCYLGAVIRAVSGHLEKNRNPLQIGAELFGHPGKAATEEVICLMFEMLLQADIQGVHLDLGHVGIYRALARQAGLSPEREERLFDVLQRKDATDLEFLLSEWDIPDELVPMIRLLPDLHGPLEILEEARHKLGAGSPAVLEALGELISLGFSLRARYPDLPLHVDLGELRGYRYHTGIVFAAFVPGEGSEIARGGRYDDIGRAFGCARPAVGFSADLKTLARLGSKVRGTRSPRILAPASGEDGLESRIKSLREEGHVVIRSLGADQETPDGLGCDQMLVLERGDWVVKEYIN